jgi:MFS superfamily sulfate permease-like transporter
VLYNAVWEIWQASQKILTALATLMGVLIKTLPQVLLAGLIALAGVALLNNLDFSNVRRPSFMHTGPGGR